MLKKIAHKRFCLFILLLTNFLDGMSIGLVYPMFSSMIFHPDAHFFSIDTSDVIRGTWLGILLAAGPLAQFFSSPIVGTLSDQKGRKPLLKYTLVIIIFGYFICALGVWLHSLSLLLLGRFIAGIGTGNAAVAYAAIADLSQPEEKAKNFGLASMSSGLGFTVGPFLGGLLFSWGFAIPFLFAMFCSMINLTLLVIWFSETHTVKNQIQLSFILGLKNLKKAFKMPLLRLLFISFFFFCVGWSFYWEFIPVTWIQEYGLTPLQVGHFYAYGAAFYALSAGVLIRPIVNRFPPINILFTALLLLSLVIFPLIIHTNINVFWVYVPIQQFLIALIFPTGTTIISNSVKEDAQGEIMGVLQSVDAFAFASSPILAGAFVGLNAQVPIVIAASCMLLASMLLLLKMRKKIF